jgi:hypothetical protein
MTLSASGITMTGAVAANSGLTVTSGGLSVSSGNLNVATGSTTLKATSITGGLTVDSLTVTGKTSFKGNVTIDSNHGLYFNTGAYMQFEKSAGAKLYQSHLYSDAGSLGSRAYVFDSESPSDRRLKRELTAIEAPLEKLGRLKGLYYHWTKGAQGKVSGRRLDETVRNAGFIAQDVQSVLPEGVVAIEDGKFLGINYEAVLAMVVEALKELNAKVDRVHADVEALQAFRAEQQKRMKDIGPGA